MKLSFQICARQSFAAGKPYPEGGIVSIEVDPATLPAADRELLARRMNEAGEIRSCKPPQSIFTKNLVAADGTTLEDLLAAIRAEEEALGT